MDEVRELIDRAVRHVGAGSEELAATLRRARARRRRRQVGAVGLALALAGGGTWLAWRALVAPPHRTPAAPGAARVVFTTQGPEDLQPVVTVADAELSQVRRLVPGSDPAWSPDGTRIAFSRASDDGSTGVWVVNADGTGERRLTVNPRGLDEAPSWSPDGRTIVFSRVRFESTEPEPVPLEDARDLYAVPADGGEPTVLLGGGSDDFAPAWSPDGTRLAFTRLAHGGPEIWVLPLEGREPVRLVSSEPGAWRAAWSPDGTRLILQDASGRVSVVGADGSGLHTLQLPPGAPEVQPAQLWTAAGVAPAFLAGSGTDRQLYVVDPAGSALVPFAEEAVGTASPSPASPVPVTSSCFESRSRGDFDGDGETDVATLHVLVPLPDCGSPWPAGTPWRAELVVSLAAGTFSVPFEDCQAPFTCRVLEGSDFDRDLRAELPIVLGPGAAVSYVGMYRVEPGLVRPLELAPPGDPGYLEPGPIEPGPILVGGPSDATSQSGFACRSAGARRELVAWRAERDDAVSPWRVHETILELRGDVFVVVGAEDRSGVTDLPPVWGTCP